MIVEHMYPVQTNQTDMSNKQRESPERPGPGRCVIDERHIVTPTPQATWKETEHRIVAAQTICPHTICPQTRNTEHTRGAPVNLAGSSLNQSLDDGQCQPDRDSPGH